MADKFEFLTEGWIDAAKKIQDEAPKPESPPAHAVKMNLVITDAPFNDGAEINAHMDTTQGDTQMDLGHLDGSDLTVTVDYDTARAIFIDQNPQASAKIQEAFTSQGIRSLPFHAVPHGLDVVVHGG